MIERDYKLFINALFKIINKGLGNWIDNLFIVLQADRSTVRRSIRHIPFYFLYSREPVLPIELDVPIWRIFFWDEVYDTAEVFIMRVRQIQRRNKDIKKIKFYLQRQRIEEKEKFDDIYRFYSEIAILVNDLVLLFNFIQAVDMSLSKKFYF